MASILVINNNPVIPTLFRAVHDTYKRIIGDAILHDGTNINHALVNAGGWITLVNRPTDRHAVLRGVHGGQQDFSRPAETVHSHEDLPPPDARQLGEAFYCMYPFPPQQQQHFSIE